MTRVDVNGRSIEEASRTYAPLVEHRCGRCGWHRWFVIDSPEALSCQRWYHWWSEVQGGILEVPCGGAYYPTEEL